MVMFQSEPLISIEFDNQIDVLLALTKLEFKENSLIFDQILKGMRDMIIKHYPKIITEVIKVSENVNSKLYSRDCFETIGF